jgi:hypothetical protein
MDDNEKKLRRREHDRKYRITHREQLNAYRRSWGAAHRESINQHRRESGYYKRQYANNREKEILERREQRASLKREVISQYSGGSSKCVRCGSSDVRVLTLDHVNGDGYSERKSRGAGDILYNYLKKNGFPDKDRYQVLCWNCQWVKRAENNENSKTFGNTHPFDSQ